MANINFIRVAQETEKAIRIIVREAGYDLNNFKEIKEVAYWMPKSVVTIDGNTAIIADWFFEKNIAADTYGAFMKSLANS